MDTIKTLNPTAMTEDFELPKIRIIEPTLKIINTGTVGSTNSLLALITEKDRQIAELNTQIVSKDAEIEGLKKENDGLRNADIIKKHGSTCYIE